MMRRSILTLLACVLAAGVSYAAKPAQPAKPANPGRWVTVNPVATELALALGDPARLVGVDQTSVLPATLASLPRVGYQRTLSTEGILSLRPTLVLATEDAGPPATLQALREANVKVEVLPAAPTVQATRERILRAGLLLNAAPRARQLVAALDRQLARARARVAAAPKPTRVLFLYTRGNASALVSGSDTPADAVLRLAGAENAVRGFTGYRALGAEALVAAAPEALLLPESAVQSLGGIDAVLALPGISLTPAGRDRRVIVMDDAHLLQFGPRLGEAVNELFDRLHSATAPEAPEAPAASATTK